MMKKLSSKELVFVKNLFLTTVLGGVIGVLNYLFNILVARYTNQDIFSIFSSALGVIYLLQIPIVAIQAVITKGVAQNKEKNLNHYKWYSLGIFSIIGLAFSLLFFLSKNVVADIASIPVEIVVFLAVTFFLAFITPVAKGLLLGLEKIVTVNLVLFLETILRFGIGFLAINNKDPLPLLILANSLPALLTTIFIIPSIKLESKGVEKVKMNFREILLTSASFFLLIAPFTFSLILVNPSFRAEFAAISLLGKLVYFAAITTASVMFARLTNEKEENSQKRSLMISLAITVLIGLVLSLIFFLFSDTVIAYTVGSNYSMISNHIGMFGLCMTGFAFVYMVANFFISKEYFGYLYILFTMTVLQILSFIFRNDTLDMVLQNQYVVYALFTLLTLFYLLFKLKSVRNVKQEIV
jgi:O-antigen/teichoic acid export membrane protein